MIIAINKFSLIITILLSSYAYFVWHLYYPVIFHYHKQEPKSPALKKIYGESIKKALTLIILLFEGNPSPEKTTTSVVTMVRPWLPH